jgi:predicted nuclease of restriction endonuclease-like RecB superfamily
VFRRFAQGRPRRQPGTMNGTEKKYADELQLRLLAEEIVDWKFEAVKLRLADKTFYTPDFMVLHNDGGIEFVETKGHWEDDARVKIKVAADRYFMFKFVALKPKTKKAGGGWSIEEF